MRSSHATSTLRVGLTASTVLGLMVMLQPAQTNADTPAAPVSCTTVTARLSDDKNFYVITAAADGDVSAITGYTFDFGDHQSYRFTFNPSGHDDRHAANTTHTYQTPGTYAVTAHVDIKVHSKASSVSSDTCKTSLSILPPNSVLPNTGIGIRNVLGIGILIAFLTAFLHHTRQRRRSDGLGKFDSRHHANQKHPLV